MMTPYELSVRRAKNWKESAKKIWKTQLIILILTVVAVAIGVGAAVIGAVTDSMVILGFGACIAALIFIVVYVFQWIFTNRVRDLSYDAPKEDQKHIEHLATALVLGLVAGLVSGVASALAEYAEIVGMIIQCIGSIVALVALVMQIIAFVKLSCSKTLPVLAKKGAKSMIIYYIVYFVTMVISIITLVMGFVIADIGEISVIGVILAVVGGFIMMVGCVVAVFMYYRAWWLISKSELDVLPESEPEEYDVYATQISVE